MRKILLTVVLGFSIFSCSDDYLDTNPNSYATIEQINELAESSPEALLALSVGGINSTISLLSEYDAGSSDGRADDFGLMSINLGLDLMSSDMNMSIESWFTSYYNYLGREQNISSTNMVWNFYYRIIRNVNPIITQIPQDATDTELLSVLGRAEALRGFAYFNLIRLYGDGNIGIPLYNQEENVFGRAPEANVYAQAKLDLENAYEHLSGFTRSSKSEIDQNIVAGLLARFYLHNGDYTNAISKASQAKASVSLMSPAELAGGFDEISNSEWMWGQEISSTNSTIYASYFSHIGNTNPGYCGVLGIYKNIDANLFNKISSTDRRQGWFDPASYGLPQYANTKFIDATFFEGDYVYMRGAEMHLIEAEARALNGDDAGAQSALFNLVVTRDPAYTQSTNTGQDLINEIRTHRSIELWGEGFAFYDMKRWNNPLVRDYVGSNHPSFGNFDFGSNAKEFVFQIPEQEILNNTEINSEDQNPL
jgi:hypothetical protein